MSREAVLEGAGLFVLPGRGVIRVRGGDRLRWLDGMVTNAVGELDPAGRSGCYALVLTRQGRIVADVHVVARPEELWLETSGSAVAGLIEHLDRFIVADDVVLTDASADLARLGVEGPRAEQVVQAVGLVAAPAADQAVALAIGGADCVVAGFGFGAFPAFQLFVPDPDVAAVSVALLEAGSSHGLVEGDAALLELLRIEAGTPALGVELDEEVLPAEARLDRAVSTGKGCYTGQEVVERLRSRDRVNHLMVGLQFDGPEPPAAGTGLEVDGRSTGELTSVACSPAFGAIGLGYVRREHSAAGTLVRAGGVDARVAGLPFGGEAR